MKHVSPIIYLGLNDSGRVHTSSRVQTFTLRQGWNILALAVTLPDGTAQFPSSLAQQIYLQGSTLGQYSAIASGQSLPAGSILRVFAGSTGNLALKGTWTSPTAITYAAGRQWIANSHFEALDVAARLPGDAPLWFFDGNIQGWRHRFLGPLAISSDHPAKLQPGEATFAATTAPFTLSAPHPTLEIRYYHQDHLGSSSVMSDANGQLVSESAYYPFGYPRQENQPRGVKESYGFTQKERDGESGLTYIKARYLQSTYGRFVSIDPLSDKLPENWISNPQTGSLYSYCLQRPLSFSDPSGADPVKIGPSAESIQAVNSREVQDAAKFVVDSVVEEGVDRAIGKGLEIAAESAYSDAARVFTDVGKGLKLVEKVAGPIAIGQALLDPTELADATIGARTREVESKAMQRQEFGDMLKSISSGEFQKSQLQQLNNTFVKPLVEAPTSQIKPLN